MNRKWIKIKKGKPCANKECLDSYHIPCDCCGRMGGSGIAYIEPSKYNFFLLQRKIGIKKNKFYDSSLGKSEGRN